MVQLLAALFGLAESALSYLGDKKNTELRNKLLALKQEILAETSKPVRDQDDARLELLYKEVPLIVEAINLEMQLNITKKKS